MTSPSPESLYQQLIHVTTILEANNIPYMVVGGIAVSIWSAPRATVDLDFLVGVTKETLPSFVESLTGAGLTVYDPLPMEFRRMVLQRMFIKEREEQLLMLDFILADEEYKAQALSRAIQLKLEGKEIKVASPEDLILLKLISGRGQDKVDVENIIRSQKDSLNVKYLKQWGDHLSVSDILSSLLA